MTLEKAMEILNLNLKEAGHKMPADCRDAVKLGVEALKRVDRYRSNLPGLIPDLLPGETDK